MSHPVLMIICFYVSTSRRVPSLARTVNILLDIRSSVNFRFILQHNFILCNSLTLFNSIRSCLIMIYYHVIADHVPNVMLIDSLESCKASKLF